MTHLAIALALAGALAAPPPRDDGPEDDRPPIELRDGDRVVLVGDALIERMQQFGYLEAILTAAHPDTTITFRNLGWSGDTVFGEARAAFGTPEDGFKALVEQVKAAEPTVLIVGYGANESWEGEAGLPRFREGMNRLLDALEATGAREIVLLSPIPHAKPSRIPIPHAKPSRIEPPGALPPIPRAGPSPIEPPDRLPHNRDVRRFADEIGAIAGARGHRFVDLVAAMAPYLLRSLADIKAGKTLPRRLHASYTSDGIHLDDRGQEALASWLADRCFGVSRRTPHAEITVGDEIAVEASHCTISDPTASPDGLHFGFTRPTLLVSHYETPRRAQGSICVNGLPEGRYRVRCDGTPLPQGHGGVKIQTVWIDDWFSYAIADGPTSVGITVVPGIFFVDNGPDLEQFEALRAAIIAKNQTYFHRYRPQNQTYLFGFRKHEQGNNAAEVEQFDRLVAEAEAEIARLKVPKTHTYELTRIAEEDADR